MNFKEKLKLSLGEEVVKDDEETLLRYSKDSSDHPPILPSVVILPRNLNDVIRAVEILYSERIPITPRGSGTSLTGGSIPSEGGAVISLERMNKIKEIDEENLTFFILPILQACKVAPLGETLRRTRGVRGPLSMGQQRTMFWKLRL
jgi:FAD/FMN-containing dehydrogenase